MSGIYKPFPVLVYGIVLTTSNPYLVGGLEHVLFFHILGIIIPTDSYFSEGLKPPTIYIYTHMILYNPMELVETNPAISLFGMGISRFTSKEVVIFCRVSKIGNVFLMIEVPIVEP